METRNKESKKPIQNRSQLTLDMQAYHKDLYWGNELMTVVGIRQDQVELEGDYSGGTHNVCQRDWLPLDGVLIADAMLKQRELDYL